MSDFRSAVRQLTRSPGFTLVAVAALALGIGANTAIFSLVRGILLRPLPFPEPERLAFIGEWSESVQNMSVSYPNFRDFAERQRTFTDFGAARSQGFNLIGRDQPERLSGAMASAGLFRALGVAPLHGQLYSDEDDRAGAERTVVIRASLWHRHFGGDPEAIGRSINLSGQLYTVIGILPDAVQYPNAQTELWVPLGLWADDYVDRGSHPGIYCIGRLRPGVTFAEAHQDLAAIAARLGEEHPATNARQSITLEPLLERAFGRVRPALLVLLGAAGCVLLIACANVANLQLARAHARAREFAVRAALGAGRARVMRQLLVESLLLGLLGCVAGVLAGWWSLEGLKSLLPASLPRVADVRLDAGVLVFALAASLTTSVLFGLVPAAHAARQDLRESLAQGGRTGARAGGRMRAALIVTEFALTCVLLVGAGLMLRTFANLHAADPGFVTERVLAFNWVLPGTAYHAPEQRRPVIDRAVARLQQLPGVSHVGIISPLPLTGSGTQNTYFVEGSTEPDPGRQPATEVFQVNEQTFAALQIPLLAGRGFNAGDHADAPRVAVVDRAFVDKNFGLEANAVGRRVRFGTGAPSEGDDYLEIIGVVPHIENYGLGRDTREQVYVSAAQSVPASFSFLLQTSQDPAQLSAEVRRAMAEVAPDLPVFGFRTMDELFQQSIGTQRLTVALLGTFAGLALTLAAVGLYGVLSTSVGLRIREIGVRMALGATAGSVVGLIVRQGVALALLGLAIGLGLALLATRLLQSVLYGISPGDPVSFAGALLLLLAVGTLACWIPARRASRVNPVEALRAE